MRKFRLKKRIRDSGENGIFNESGRFMGIDGLDNTGDINEDIEKLVEYADFLPEIFEEVFTEINTPKFKVGDYAVANKINGFSRDMYIKINSIHIIGEEFTYNFERFRVKDLRLPTEEELKKYFR